MNKINRNGIYVAIVIFVILLIILLVSVIRNKEEISVIKVNYENSKESINLSIEALNQKNPNVMTPEEAVKIYNKERENLMISESTLKQLNSKWINHYLGFGKIEMIELDNYLHGTLGLSQKEKELKAAIDNYYGVSTRLQ
jgi:hypothetical protein